jgi:hypothetical protein
VSTSLNFEKLLLQFMTGLTRLFYCLTDSTCCCVIAVLLQRHSYLLNDQMYGKTCLRRPRLRCFPA